MKTPVYKPVVKELQTDHCAVKFELIKIMQK